MAMPGRKNGMDSKKCPSLLHVSFSSLFTNGLGQKFNLRARQLRESRKTGSISQRGWAETKILFCVLLMKVLSPTQQGVVPGPIRISLVVWLAAAICARSRVPEHRPLFYAFSLGVV